MRFPSPLVRNRVPRGGVASDMVASGRRFSSLMLLVVALFCAMPLAAQNMGIGDDDRQAAPVDPREYSSKVRLAQAYEESRDITSAVRVYQQLYHTNPGDEYVFERLSECLMYLKRYDEAEQIVKYRLSKDHSLEVQLTWAKIEARMNKPGQAQMAFEEAEKLVSATDCTQLFPIVYAMMDVSYNKEAIALLDHVRQLSTNDADVCSSQIAGLYLRLGDFDRATKEFVALLKVGEGNVGMVEQRLAQYMTDSMSRASVLGSLETAIKSEGPSIANMRVLAWMYQEKKDYAKALETIVRLDDEVAKERTNDRTQQGFELLQFADRVRSEGALDVAVKAYQAALSRLAGSAKSNYFVQQAELGALKTAEAYYTSLGSAKDSVTSLIKRYEEYAARPQQAPFAMDALNHAGALAYSVLFDLDRATKDFESAVALSRGVSEPMSKAVFALVDIAFAKQDFALAEQRLARIEDAIPHLKSASEKEIHNHILYDHGLALYYQGQFDSAVHVLAPVADDAASDFANDAIALSSLIQENVKPANRPALAIYAKAALDEASHRYDSALTEYTRVVDLFSKAPIADDASIRSAEVLVKTGRAAQAIVVLDSMQETMINSPLLDQAAFRAAEITERELHDKPHAQKRYEDFLARYPGSTFGSQARERARRLRGDAF
jgi:tetratricopeptide (TPR) repeat protein